MFITALRSQQVSKASLGEGELVLRALSSPEGGVDWLRSFDSALGFPCWTEKIPYSGPCILLCHSPWKPFLFLESTSKLLQLRGGGIKALCLGRRTF